MHCSVKETLKIKNEGDCKLIVANLYSKYKNLRAQILDNTAWVEKICLKADGKEYSVPCSYRREEFFPKFDILLNVIPSAKEIELNADYQYNWFSRNTEDTPYRIERLLNHGSVQAKDFFYAEQVQFEDDWDFNLPRVYGEKDGKQYCGRIDYEAVEALPEDGYWCADDILISFYTEDFSGVDVNGIISAGQAFQSFGGDCYWEITEKKINFMLEEVQPLESREDFEKFIALYLDFYRAVNDNPGLCSYLIFVDESRLIRRALILDINIDGSYTVKMAAV